MFLSRTRATCHCGRPRAIYFSASRFFFFIRTNKFWPSFIVFRFLYNLSLNCSWIVLVAIMLFITANMLVIEIGFYNIIVTGFVPRLWVMTLWMIFAVDTQFKQLRKRSLKKIQASAGFEPVTSEVTQFKQLRKRSLKKIQLQRDWTRDLWDTGAVLYQLSYEAITVGSRSILVGPSCH